MALDNSDMPDVVAGACVCYDVRTGGHPCVCTATERQLRLVMDGGAALTPAQREWCLAEIDGVEGHTRADFDDETDVIVAREVLDAWRDYARDKGLL